MLSSTPSSLLLSTALPSLNTASGAGGEGPTASQVPGFAELLNKLSQKASGTAETEVAGGNAVLPTANARSGENGEVPVTSAAPSFVDSLKNLSLKARGAKESEASPNNSAASTDPKHVIETAMAAKAASPTGKILPVPLPEAAEAETAEVTTAETPDAAVAELADIEIDPATALALLAGLAQQLKEVAEKPQPVAADIARTALPQAAALAASARPAGKAIPAAAKDAAPPTTVAITVAPKSEAAPAPASTATATPEIAANAPSKPQRAEPIRAEAPLQPVLHATPSIAAAVDAAPAPSAPAMPVATAPAAMPSPVDINAALDRLVAAREALMPAEAALAVDHAEFGEISIRFEQGSDGRLSAELRAADPELQRAVTAAAGADRGLAMGADSEGGRPTHLAHQRGSATGGETASGERSQPGQERDTNQRRGSGRSATDHEGKNDPRPGVFA